MNELLACRQRATTPCNTAARARAACKLPAISLGLWHNFGHDTEPQRSREMLFTAFDLGITHFDLANNYGPPPGTAEEFFGTVMQSDFKPYRDEMIISSKAGWDMWPGPYGDGGSRKYLLASLDQSLKRMKLDYVDIFYSHRFDPNTPLEETMGALDTAVRQGKALYVGISSYSNAQTKEAAAILKRLGTPCLIHQPSYSMFNRWTERDNLLDRLETEGMGCIVFSPLQQGVLTDRYLDGIPADSRAAGGRFLKAASITRKDRRPRACAEGDRRAPRPEARADGAGVGAARSAHDLGADRRQPAGAGARCGRRAGQPRPSRRRNWPRSTSMRSKGDDPATRHEENSNDARGCDRRQRQGGPRLRERPARTRLRGVQRRHCAACHSELPVRAGRPRRFRPGLRGAVARSTTGWPTSMRSSTWRRSRRRARTRTR